MGVDWRHRDTPTSDGDYVVASGFVQKEFEDRFSLNRTTPHHYSLVISRLRPDDQGLYICIEDAGLGPRRGYQLIIKGRSVLYIILLVSWMSPGCISSLDLPLDSSHSID